MVVLEDHLVSSKETFLNLKKKKKKKRQGSVSRGQEEEYVHSPKLSE